MIHNQMTLFRMPGITNGGPCVTMDLFRWVSLETAKLLGYSYPTGGADYANELVSRLSQGGELLSEELHVETASKFIMPGIIFLLTLASGVWLSSSGKPLNTLIFTLHKLIALAAVVVTAIQVYGLLKNTDIQALIVALISLTGVWVVALFATGALMSQAKPVSGLLLTIHRVTPFLAVICMAVTIYLLSGRKL